MILVKSRDLTFLGKPGAFMITDIMSGRNYIISREKLYQDIMNNKIMAPKLMMTKEQKRMTKGLIRSLRRTLYDF